MIFRILNRRSITSAWKVGALILMGAVLAGCAEPIPKALITPEYSGPAPAKLNVGMTDHRTFILSGNKEEWFEGIVRGGYGIPLSLKRPGPQEGQPFTIFLSSMLAEGLRNEGTDVAVIAVTKGADESSAVETVSGSTGVAGVVFTIIHSRYDVGFSAEYKHHFDVVIADKDGGIVLKKTFSQFDTEVTPSAKYTVFDMYAAIYKTRLDEILRDADVVKALSSLTGSPTT